MEPAATACRRYAMPCQEVAFAAAKCRIEIGPVLGNGNGNGTREFAATMALIDEGSRTLRPLIVLDGRPAEVHADSESHALRQAIAFLERRLGSSRRVALLRDRTRLPVGEPITIAE
jgi:hypothetical protein